MIKVDEDNEHQNLMKIKRSNLIFLFSWIWKTATTWFSYRSRIKKRWYYRIIDGLNFEFYVDLAIWKTFDFERDLKHL